jgi:hypothetical protein
MPLPGGFSPRLSPRLSPTPFRCSASTTSARSAEEALLALLASSGAKGRGAALTAEQEADVHRLATELEESAPTGDDTNTSPLLPGRWRVLYQGKPGGEKTEFFSAESWKKYLSGDGMQKAPHRICTAFSRTNTYENRRGHMQTDAQWQTSPPPPTPPPTISLPRALSLSLARFLSLSLSQAPHRSRTWSRARAASRACTRSFTNFLPLLLYYTIR